MVIVHSISFEICRIFFWQYPLSKFIFVMIISISLFQTDIINKSNPYLMCSLQLSRISWFGNSNKVLTWIKWMWKTKLSLKASSVFCVDCCVVHVYRHTCKSLDVTDECPEIITQVCHLVTSREIYIKVFA